MSADDTIEIVRISNVYALAVDLLRWDLFDGVFTADVEADYGPTGRWRDLETFKRDFDTFHRPLDASQHTLANHQVVIRGDQANSLIYGIWRLMRHVPQGGGDFWLGGGWYDDEWVRTGQGWRIKKRVCCVGWWEGNPRVGDTIPGIHFEQNAMSIRREADAGNIAYLRALAQKK
jgi:SnoaL-like protein